MGQDYVFDVLFFIEPTPEGGGTGEAEFKGNFFLFHMALLGFPDEFGADLVDVFADGKFPAAFEQDFTM